MKIKTLEKANELMLEINNLKEDLDFLKRCVENTSDRIDIQIRMIPAVPNLAILGKSAHTVGLLTESEINKIKKKLAKLEEQLEKL